MTHYKISFLPACTDWTGREYPDRWSVTKICSRGLRWDGGEFLTRAEAVSCGLQSTHKTL